MFDDILKLVQDHLGNDPAVAAVIPADQADAIHNEIATRLTNAVGDQIPVDQSDRNADGDGGMFGSLLNSATSGGSIGGAIEGGLVGTLTTKFGLSPEIAGAISGALPGLLQKMSNKE
jgi:hypothetical protein